MNTMDRKLENEIKLATALLKHIDGSTPDEMREYLEDLEPKDANALFEDLDDLKRLLRRIHEHYDGELKTPERVDLDLHFTHITQEAKNRILAICGFGDLFRMGDEPVISFIGNMGDDFFGMSAKIECTSLPTSQHEDDLEIEEARRKGELIEEDGEGDNENE